MTCSENKIPPKKRPINLEKRRTENGERRVEKDKNGRLNWLTWILGGKTSRYK